MPPDSARPRPERLAHLLPFQWGLVCGRQGLKPVGQAVFMAGNLLGALAWGLLSCW